MPYLQENVYLVMAMSEVFAALRVLGAIGLRCKRFWGFGLSVVMKFLLPAGIADGVLSGTALVLKLFAGLGRRSDGQVRMLV